MSRVAVIDADSILYAVALSAEMCAKGHGMDGEDLWFDVRTLKDCYKDVIERLDAAAHAINADDAIICLSDRRCFRYDILPTYKANRARTRRPPMMVKLRETILERKPYMVLAVDTLEADDVCGITSGAMQRAGKKEPVIISEDKDLLSIPGMINRKGQTFMVTEPDADRAHLYQALIGDAVDGYTGLPGVGPKKADRILDSADEPSSVASMYRAMCGAFVARGLTEEDCLTQCRVSRILRVDDWDHTEKRAKLWMP